MLENECTYLIRKCFKRDEFPESLNRIQTKDRLCHLEKNWKLYIGSSVVSVIQRLKLLVCPITKPPSILAHPTAGLNPLDNSAFSTHQTGLLLLSSPTYPRCPPTHAAPLNLSTGCLPQPMQPLHPETYPILKHLPRSQDRTG